MKKTIVLFGVLFFGLFSFNLLAENENVSVRNNVSINSTIPDGWYHSTVSYFNYNTFTESKYTLDVKVESDRVVKIDFGNGGSVHTGLNNEGYTYTGGYLSFEKDFNDNITAATSSVSITTPSGTRTYTVRIG